ncbi:MAG: sugar phosphate isomerase/epimerase, partial [Oscillospiraceae bacterium]|nr:sugar phosphate isomerase/epimerase [Oscillospiraceae bacterium]
MTKLRREQIAGANYHYTRYPLSYFIGSMQKNGIHKIEFYAAAPHLYVFDYEPAEVKAIKKQLDAAQIDVICFTAEQCFYPISIAMDDSRVRERSIRYYERALEQAAALECPRMQMISGAGLCGSDPAEDWKRSADAIHQIVKKAESLGITIVL